MPVGRRRKLYRSVEAPNCRTQMTLSTFLEFQTTIRLPRVLQARRLVSTSTSTHYVTHISYLKTYKYKSTARLTSCFSREDERICPSFQTSWSP